VPWPAHQAGDIALLFVETQGSQAVSFSNAQGFQAVPDSPQSVNNPQSGTRLSVFWARATSGAMPSPQIADPGNHVYAVILTYRGVVSTGNPWDATAGGNNTGMNTTVTVPGVTTTVPDTLIVQAVTRQTDSGAAFVSNQSNANLTGIAERFDDGTTSGNGGGIGVWDGVFAGPGATGDTTATVSNSVNAYLTIALRPPVDPELVSASIICGATDQVQVAFSRPVTQATAENPANYALDGGATISGASLDSTGQVVTLTTSTLTLGQLYTLTVNNVASTAGGVIAPNSQTTFYSEGGYLSGLLGSYYANMTLSGTPAGTRIDGPVDFDWANGAPGVAGIGADNFSVRWTGFVTPSVSGSYTFRTRSDDGVRLYLDGALIIDNWTDHAATNDDSAPIALNAGQRYAVTMEFYENGGQAVAQLLWSGPGTGGFQFIPRPNLSYFCGLPRPVAFYKLDESSWVAAGDVADASGNGLNATAVGGSTPVPAQVCNGSLHTAVDEYLQVNHDVRLNMTGSFTVATWINANALGTELKTIVSKDENYEFHLNNAGQINWWWQNSGGTAQTFTTTGAAIVPGNWHHVAVVYEPGNQVIYIDGVSRGTAAFAGGLLTNTDPLQIGADQYPSQPGRVFDGRIDEVRVYDQALTPAQVVEAMNATRPCAVTLDHYNISHSGSGVACDTHQITITAHDAAHNPVDAGARTVALSTTNSRGTWTGIAAGGGTLSDPTAGDGAATYQFAVGSNSVILNFRYANLAGTSETFGFNVFDGTYSETSGTAAGTEDPSFTMAQAGFRFNNVTDGNTTIPVQISGKPSSTGWNAKTIRIQAIRTDAATGSCVGLFASQTRSVDLGAECNSPASCAARQLSVNGGNIATSNDNAGAGAAAYTSVSLAFNAASEADTVIAYPDAGQVSLHARYDLDPDVAGFEALGGSNAFVVRPFGLAFPGASHANTATGALLAAAGDPFPMTVQAYQWGAGEDADANGVPDAGVNITDNGTVPNFAATATVGVSANLPGVAPGAIARGAGCAGAPSIALAGGIASAADWCYSEAGNVLLTASVANYLAPGVSIAGSSGFDGDPNGGYVGRFRPKHFAVTGAPALTNRSALACASAFTYLNEGLDLDFTLEARNAQDVLTLNYTGAYARLSLATAASLGLGARSGATDLTARVDASLAPSGAFANGAAALAVTTGVRRASPDNPDGPFAGTQFGIAPVDPDGVAMGTLNLDVDGAGGNDHFAVGPTTELRYGRLRLQNAYGPTNLPLRLPLEVQYWSGGGFATNSLDACTRLNRSDIALTFSGALAACETAVQEASLAFAGGAALATLAAPGASNQGTVTLAPQLGAAAGTYCPSVGAGTAAATSAGAPYLLGRWNDAADPDGDANTAYDDNPAGQAAFGLYGSQPRNFIFLRENY